MSKKALGKGLEAILPGTPGPGSDRAPHRLPVADILPNRLQPRKTFAEHELRELADSIRHHGILHPILVRRKGGGVYEIIAGERRFRAAKLAKLTDVPVIIRQSKDDDATLLALIENIQRVNLNPVEEARAYRRLMDEFGLTQDAVAGSVGRDRASVANLCRILSLPRDVQAMLESGALTLGHAKVMAGLKRADAQTALAQRIARQGLSVRQIERLVKAGGRGSRRRPARSATSTTRTLADVEERLRRHLKTKVTLRANSKARGGDVMLRYYSREDLTRIVDVIVS